MSEATASEPLLFEVVEDHVALVRFNRPEARNAIDVATAQALNAAVDRIEADPAIRVAILTSATPGMFCAGADLKVIAAGRVQELRPNDAGFGGFVDAIKDKPWIAAVDGPALGGGTGNSRLSRVLPRNVALELIATGEAFSAQFAAGYGMVNRVVAADELMETALGLARIIVGNAPVAVTESLRVARQSADRSDTDLRRLSRERNRLVLATEDSKEGPRAFAEKRAPVWQGR